jgi:hypothetical protein
MLPPYWCHAKASIAAATFLLAAKMDEPATSPLGIELDG